MSNANPGLHALPRPNFLRAHHAAPLNDHIKTSLVTVTCVAMQLIAGGYTILGVHVGRRNPVIKIADGPEVEALHGVPRIQRTLHGVREVTMVALREGVQVEWDVRG